MLLFIITNLHLPNFQKSEKNVSSQESQKIMKNKRREGERSPKLRAERERASVIDLPRCIIAKVLTYASVPSTHLRLLFPCKDESAWAALCASRFRTGSDLLRDWPAFKSWRRLYHVLECYLPMEGFYTLLETNPFGMLFRFSFQRGKFVGSMMFPTYDDTDHHFFKDVPIFELSFTETSSSAQLLGSLCVRLGVTHFEKKHPFTNWCIAEGTKRNAMIAIARYPSMYPLIIEGRRIDIDLRDHNNVENNSVKKKNVVSSVLGTMYDSMRVLMNDDEDETFRQTPFQRLTYAWHPQNSFGDDDDDDDTYSGVSGKRTYISSINDSPHFLIGLTHTHTTHLHSDIDDARADKSSTTIKIFTISNFSIRKWTR